MSEATKQLGLEQPDEPTAPEKFNMQDHVNMFVAGAKDFGEDVKSMASGELKGPSMKHRLEYLNSKK